MKEYKYKINGNLYKVSVGEIEKNIAHVEVNGTVYNVEMEEAAPVKVMFAPNPLRLLVRLRENLLFPNPRL